MTHAPAPVVFVPQFVPKPWGGRRLATLLNKTLPPHEPIGESWELSDLPGHPSVVRDGPLAGTPLPTLVAQWGDDLLGGAPLIGGHFPLLVKFLDAAEALSVQVHPKPGRDDPNGCAPGVKHEAWYVVHAEPAAELFIGLRPGVDPRQVAEAANTPQMAELLQSWPGQAGASYYLPSGTPHALGAGLVVAEVQTPSDVTYRAYDWNRVGLDGRLRQLHVPEALANIRYDITTPMIHPAPSPIAGSLGPATRIVTCDRFVEDLIRVGAGHSAELPSGVLRVWIILAGHGVLACSGITCSFAPGDVVLFPAACRNARIETLDACTWIEVTVPQI